MITLGCAFESKLYTRCYDSFKSHLCSRGFLVYPTEFDCIYSDHPFVDIAAKMGSFYWAFEYKSELPPAKAGGVKSRLALPVLFCPLLAVAP
jgi:hypothetical protein